MARALAFLALVHSGEPLQGRAVANKETDLAFGEPHNAGGELKTMTLTSVQSEVPF